MSAPSSPTKASLYGAILFTLQQTRWLPVSKATLIFIFTMFMVSCKVSFPVLIHAHSHLPGTALSGNRGWELASRSMHGGGSEKHRFQQVGMGVREQVLLGRSPAWAKAERWAGVCGVCLGLCGKKRDKMQGRHPLRMLGTHTVPEMVLV